jgi:hypothetical protein
MAAAGHPASPVQEVGACRHQAEPAPTHHPQEGAPVDHRGRRAWRIAADPGQQ